jgi:hypothetical protein
MDQLDSDEYYRKSHNSVTTVHEFAICFAGNLCAVGSRTRTRTRTMDGTDWTVENHTFPGAQFQASKVKEQKYDPIVGKKLKEEEKLENCGQRKGGSGRSDP